MTGERQAPQTGEVQRGNMFHTNVEEDNRPIRRLPNIDDNSSDDEDLGRDPLDNNVLNPVEPRTQGRPVVRRFKPADEVGGLGGKKKNVRKAKSVDSVPDVSTLKPTKKTLKDKDAEGVEVAKKGGAKKGPKKDKKK